VSDELRLFIPITKIDASAHTIYGTVTEELEDKSGETFDYVSSKPHYVEWSGEFAKATDGRSVGNLRSMHNNKVAGMLTQLLFDDTAKRIECVAHVVDEGEWQLCLAGAYTGLSQGGRYKKRWTDDAGVQRYTVEPVEVSLVDNPCLPTARFSLIKADGTTEDVPFKVEPKPETPVAEVPKIDNTDTDTTVTDPPSTDTDVPNTEQAATEKVEDDDAAYLRRFAALNLGLDQSRDAIGKRDCGYRNV
jgi:hypothetical protein